LLKNPGINNLHPEHHRTIPNLNSILIISLGLIFVAILSSTLVYAETVSVSVEGNTFDVEYTGDGVSVTGIEPDLDFVSLIFTVDVTSSPGTLEVTFERSFFDSVYQGSDDDFIVLADGDEPSYSETETTDQTRTLSITLPSGTDEVEIIGSVFGTPAPEPVAEPAPEPVAEPAPEPVAEPAPEPVAEPTTVPIEDVEDMPQTECGPGTILKDGVCVLDEMCGPGTILKDGVCVIESTPITTTSPKALGKELIYGFMAAFAIAGGIGIILGLISKASKSS
jgi:hypothetical protein